MSDARISLQELNPLRNVFVGISTLATNGFRLNPKLLGNGSGERGADTKFLFCGVTSVLANEVGDQLTLC